MLALVKTGPGPGLSLETVPEPSDRHQRRPHPGPQDGDLRDRPPHRGLGRLGGAGRSTRRWSSVTSSSARSSRSGSNVTDFRPGRPRQRRGPRRLRPLPPLPGRAAAPVRPHDRPRRRTAQGAFAEYVALPMTNVWHHWPGIDEEVAAIFDPFGNAVHTALSFPVLGEDVLVTGAGPIGLMAIAVARHAGARHIVVVRAERLPPRAGAGRWARRLVVDPATADLADVQAELGMTEGFDVAMEMSGNAAALRDRRSPTWPTAADRDPGHPVRPRSRSTSTRSSSRCSRSRASTAGRCTRPGTR